MAIQEPHQYEETTPVETLSALPDGGLSRAQFKALEQSEALDGCAPLVEHRVEKCVTHVELTLGQTQYFFGWDPTEEDWAQLLAVEMPGDGEPIEIEAFEVYDDETQEPVLVFELDEDNLMECIYDHVRKCVEHVYDDTEDLWFHG